MTYSTTHSDPAPAPAASVPRWLLPRVRVRQQGQVICVQQVVPARVAEIHTTTTRTSGPGMSGMSGTTQRTRLYESGLGAPSSIPLVRERLTIPAGAVGPEQVERAVEDALGSFRPTAYRSGPARPSPALLPHLIGAMASLAFAGAAIAMAVRLRMDLADSVGPAQPPSFLMAFPAVFALVGVWLAAVLARRAWILRTPRSIAEDQWVLLRQVLMGMAGQEPGSSRPLDVELGRRRDLLTHPPSQYPQGARLARATTADGRMGPPWPDAWDVRRRVGVGRRRALVTGLFLAVVLGLGSLIATGIILGMGLPVLPFACVALGIAGAIMLVALRDADPVVLAYPRHLPGDRGLREVALEDVDAPSLPGWCAARRREDAWEAAAITCTILFAGSIMGLLAGGAMSMLLLPPVSSGAASSGPAGLLAPVLTGAVAVVVAVSAVLGARRVARRDAERRRRAGLA